MEELALHILDLVENATRAGAGLVHIEICEDLPADRLSLTVQDNGRGMSTQMAASAADPFVTTRGSRRVGLGLSLLEAAAKASGGGLKLHSTPGRGTRVRAELELSHLDRQPLGHWPSTLAGIITANPKLDVEYVHRVGEGEFGLSSTQLRLELGAKGLSDPTVFGWLRGQIKSALHKLGSRA